LTRVCISKFFCVSQVTNALIPGLLAESGVFCRYYTCNKVAAGFLRWCFFALFHYRVGRKMCAPYHREYIDFASSRAARETADKATFRLMMMFASFMSAVISQHFLFALFTQRSKKDHLIYASNFLNKIFQYLFEKIV